MTRIVVTGLVIVHLAASLWHGNAHTHLGIELSSEQTLFIYIVIIIAPILAATLVWTRYVSMGAFCLGTYHAQARRAPSQATLPAAEEKEK